MQVPMHASHMCSMYAIYNYYEKIILYWLLQEKQMKMGNGITVNNLIRWERLHILKNTGINKLSSTLCYIVWAN